MLLGSLALSARRASAGENSSYYYRLWSPKVCAAHSDLRTNCRPNFGEKCLVANGGRGWERRIMAPEVPATVGAMAFSLIFLMAPTTLGLFRVKHFVANQPAYEAKNYPVAAVNYLSDNRLPGPIYNRYGWGGYLIRRLYPEYRVYIDGRADVYGDAFMVETMKTFDGHKQWRDPLDRLAVRTVLIPPNAPLSSLLSEDNQWKKVYEDKQAVIFTRSFSDMTAAKQEVQDSSNHH